MIASLQLRNISLIQRSARKLHGKLRCLLIVVSVTFPSFLTQLLPEIRVVMIDPSENGFIQIAEALEGVSDIDVIHILSHGADGMLLLGASSISNIDLENYSGELATIGGSLGEKGDILLYGCDVAGKRRWA